MISFDGGHNENPLRLEQVSEGLYVAHGSHSFHHDPLGSSPFVQRSPAFGDHSNASLGSITDTSGNIFK